MSAFDGTKYYPIVKDMKIRFRRPAKSDITVEVRITPEQVAEIQAEAEANGKADYSWQCELKDESGEVIKTIVTEVVGCISYRVPDGTKQVDWVGVSDEEQDLPGSAPVSLPGTTIFGEAMPLSASRYVIGCFTIEPEPDEKETRRREEEKRAAPPRAPPAMTGFGEE